MMTNNVTMATHHAFRIYMVVLIEKMDDSIVVENLFKRLIMEDGSRIRHVRGFSD